MAQFWVQFPLAYSDPRPWLRVCTAVLDRRYLQSYRSVLSVTIDTVVSICGTIQDVHDWSALHVSCLHPCRIEHVIEATMYG